MLAERMGGDDINRARTGIPLDAGAVAAKLAWLADAPARAHGGGARDPVAARLHRVPHDRPDGDRRHLRLAQRPLRLRRQRRARAGRARRWASSRASCRPTPWSASSRPVPGAELGLRPGIPVVIGAGDRQCEVLGSGASEYYPMVSWGTTANVSVPVQERPVPSPAGAVVTRGADGGWLLEGGLSAAGYLPGLARPPARPRAPRSWGGWRRRAVRAPAAWSPCRGSTAPAPRGGATTPGPASWVWARRTVPADMARAVVESVAWDVAAGDGGRHGRAPRRLDGRRGDAGRRRFRAARLGRGADVRARACRPLRHRSGEAASAGAALLAGKALGMGLTLDQLDPVEAVIEPTPGCRSSSTAALRPQVDHVAAAVLAATESLAGTRSAGALIHAGRAGLRPPRDRRSRYPTTPRSSCRWTSRGWRTRRRPSPTALRQPLAVRRCATWSAGRGAWPSSSPTSRGPCRTGPCCRRCWRSWRGRVCRRPPSRLLCATGTHRQATAGGDGGARRSRHRGGATPSSTTTRTDARRARRGRRGRRDPGPAAARVRRGRRAHHHRVRRAAFLRRLQRRAQGGLSRAGRQLDTILEAHHPRRIADAPGHLRHPDRATRCTTSCAPRPRWPHPTCRSTSPSTGRAR